MVVYQHRRYIEKDISDRLNWLKVVHESFRLISILEPDTNIFDIIFTYDTDEKKL